jgi:hypothetical protein
MTGVIVTLIALASGVLFFFFRKNPSGGKKPDSPGSSSGSSATEPTPSPSSSSSEKSQVMVYALLIAIDKYHPRRVGALSGCVSDSKAIKSYLEESIPAGGLKLKTLYDQEATKENIVSGFLDFLSQAEAEDTVFIHYSGHGSQEKAHPSLWHLDPDHLNETVVCFDPHELLDQGEPVTQLADKELGWLIHQVAKKDPHIVVMMDCCHSGSGTRARKVDPDVKVRSSTGNTTTPKALSKYVFYEKDRDLKQRIDQGEEISIPSGRHIALSACRSFELANEQTFPEGRYGVFTYNFLKTINISRGDISYRDLIQRVGVMTANTVSYQIPQVYSTHSDDLKKTFLKGSSRKTTDYYQAIYSAADGGWTLLAGSIQGIPAPANGETTQLALYEDDEALEKRAIDQAILASVREVNPDKSKLAIVPGYQARNGTTYKAIIVSSPLSRTGIHFTTEPENKPDDSLLQALQMAREAYQQNDQAGLFLEEKTSLKDADLQLIAYSLRGEVRYRITRRDDERALVKPIVYQGTQSAARAIQELMHISRWNKTLNLQNPDTRIQPKDIELVIMDENDQPIDLKSKELKLKYQYDTQSGKWKKPGVKFMIRNHSGKNLYAALLHLEADFSISAKFFPGEWFGLREVKAGDNVLRTTEVNEAYIGQNDQYKNGRVIRLSVPNELLQQGITEVEDHFKLIISTEEFSAYELEQGALQLASATRSVASAEGKKVRGGKNALNKLFRAIHTRAAGFDEEEEEPTNFADWTTSQISIRTIRPPENSRALMQNLGMDIQLPDNFKGELQLSSLDYQPASRSIGGETSGEILLPFFLHNSTDSEVIPFNTGTRNAGAELNVLEIKGIEDTKAVTADSPIRVKLPVALEEDSFMMAVATDGELFYPVGLSGRSEGAQTEIAIESLPEPAELQSGQRGLFSGIKNTVKIIFQKVRGNIFELPSGQLPPYIRQALPGPDGGKELSYEDNTVEIASRIGSATKVALVLHGFIGDTHSLLIGDKNRTRDLFSLLEKKYDIILSFDYDSYNTSLEDSAAFLKNRLEVVGLSENHQKKLDIIAHGTGALVARWMIEMLEEAPVVNKLIMTGPPNGGSILPQVKKSLHFGATLVMNGLDAVGLAFPKALALLKGAQILFDRIDKFSGGKISKTIEEISEDKVSDSLAGNSEFLTSLNEEFPEGANYIVVSGNTGLIKGDEKEIRSKISKIVRLTGLDKLKYNVADVLLGDKNDLAVTAKSMSNVPDLRSEQILEAGCDHYTYFELDEGLDKIEEALDKN